MKQQDQSAQVKKFTNNIKDLIKMAFTKDKIRVEELNKKQIEGLQKKTDKSQKIYALLDKVDKQLRSLQKKVRECGKLRKQRRQFYEAKVDAFSKSIGSLIKQKSIKIKINDTIQGLASKSFKTVQQVLKILRQYQVQSQKFCGGNSYQLKPILEKSFSDLFEFGFIWENISKFQSITNESVKQLYLAVPYEAKTFQDLEKQIQINWPKPKQIEKKVEKQKNQQIVQTKSQLQLAHQLFFGFTRPQQIAKALQIYQKEASKQAPNASALNSLGTLYQQGKGVSKDTTKAFKYFMSSAKLGDPQGLYKVGKYLEKGLLNSKQFFEGLYANREAQIRGGIQYYEKAAAKDHLDALTDLGYIYEKGVLYQNCIQYYIEPHPEHAVKYYQKAKSKDFPRALNNLGNFIISQSRTNSTMSQNADLQKGIKYLQKAVLLKYPKSYINLGVCYQTGTGVNTNIQKARSLFKEAAALGEVQGRLEYLRSYIGTNLQSQETMSSLVETARLALLQNGKNAEALYLMGLFEQKGIGITANKQASFYYMASAARLDYPLALTRVGDYYYSGHYVQRNYQNAKLFYEKAGEKGQSQALLNLALMHQKGLLPMGSTLGEAQQLYIKAQELGNTNALLIRGLKKQGNVTQNQKIIKAAQQGNIQALRLLNKQNTNYSKLTYGNTQDEFKKMSTFYVKQTNYKRSGMKN